jgi:hypothetical protein
VAARGNGFVNKTSPERMAAFGADMGKALADINDAIRLDAGNPCAFYLKLARGAPRIHPPASP